MDAREQPVSPGDQEAQAAAQLFSLVYGELHAIANSLARNNHSSVQATALVNEAYLALCEREPNRTFERDHFLRTAALVMRHLLIDHKRRSASRHRHITTERLPLDELVDRYEARVGDLLVVAEALDRIAIDDPESVRLIDLHFFAGLSLTECASAMDVSPRTITRWWALARARLAKELTS
ncbi:MAG: ECF-type sigma factor [Planctomycetota bacterium]